MRVEHATLAMISTKTVDLDSALASWRGYLDTLSPVLVGFSGGLDSSVLLHIACRELGVERVIAVHINHGLSPNADAWQKWITGFCKKSGVELHAEAVEVFADGDGLEAAARDARYAVFERLLADGGCLLLAHHADDQVETVLYHLLRGSGPRGLGGIPETRDLGAGTLIRPLLDWSKDALEHYARENGIHWIEDESNERTDFDRNFVRHQVVPQLRERWPDYYRRIGNASRLCRHSDSLSEMIAEQDLCQLKLRDERAGQSISLKGLMNLPSTRCENLLHYWPGNQELPLPGYRVVQEVMNSLLTARSDAVPQVSWRGAQFCRYRDRLYLLRRHALEDEMEPDALTWDVSQPMALPDGSLLHAALSIGGGLRYSAQQFYEISFRQGGERCKPQHRNKSNSLKRLLQEYALEPWWRERVPLIYVDGELAAVGDLWICDGWQAEAHEPGLKIHWHVNSV